MLREMKRFAFGALCGLVVVGNGQSAFAQTFPAGEVMAGYSVYRDLTFETSAPVGWVVAPAVNVRRWFSVVGDAGGNYGGDNGGAEHAFGAGPRLRYSWTNVSLYVQWLPGVAIYGGHANFMLQSGVGLDFTLAPAWAVRLESGARMGNIGDDSSVRWRGLLGVVYRVGSR